MNVVISFFSAFVFWYPLVMSIVWIIGGTIFFILREKGTKRLVNELIETPMVSILVPCYNEEETISTTIRNLNQLNYPHYEIIAINDGSKDHTKEVLNELAEQYDKLRVIQLETNAGKANALYLGLIAAKGEYLAGVDADAYLDPDALNYVIPHFTTPNHGERVGAVTGNPRVRNRTSLLAKIQLCEFSSIISLTKRSQRLLGKVMTVSGVFVVFRKRALLDCGLWDRDVITEDIGITWKLQKRFWDVRYEPRAICWMLVPERLVGLWKQRIRWAQGGIEVMVRHLNVFTDWRYRRLIPVYLEQVLSMTWSIAWAIFMIYSIYLSIIGEQSILQIFWQGQFLALLSLVQFAVAMLLDSYYDEKLFRYYIWAVWYPTIYWYVNAFVLIAAIPKVLFKDKSKQFATWESPDRGL